MKIKKKKKTLFLQNKENRIWNTDKCKMSKKKQAVNNMNHILVIG